MVDMLQFLDRFDSTTPSVTAKEYLIGDGGSYTGRRPDIRHIALSCENTDTTLPYVDLVNELLERHVAQGAIPATIQTDASSTELLATPQILTASTFATAYEVLSGEAAPIVYPWSLPYSLWQHEARVYLEHLGTTRAQLMELLQRRFQPGDIPGCVAWLRADTAVATSEGRVTRWHDLSGGGYALSPVAGELAPFYRAAGGSKDQPYLDFTGSEVLHVLDEEAASLDLTGDVTIVVIASDASGGWIVAKGATGVSYNYGVALLSNRLTAVYNSLESGPTIGPIGPLATIGITTLSTTGTTWRVDSVESTGATHGTNVNNEPLYLGAQATGAAPAASFSGHLTGRIYEVLIFSDALTQDQLEALEAYAYERYGASLTSTTGPSPTPLAIAQERLGMSAPERALIVDDPSPDPWPHWGFSAEGTWTTDLEVVGTFLSKSGITYDQLRELLDGRFMLALAASPGVPPTLSVMTGTTGCHVDEQAITGLATPLEDTWNAVQRFLRLQRRLGWEVRDLDKMVTALTGGTHSLDDDLIRHLGDAVALTEHPQLRRVKWAELASFWADLDTQATPSLDEPSFFDTIYRSKALSNPAIFDVSDGGRIEDHFDDVLAGLVAAAADVRLLIDGEEARRHLNLLPAVPTHDISLSNLSRLYRLVAFARRLRLPVSDVVVLQALSGINALTGDSAAPATPAETRAFLAELEAVKTSGVRIPELHYLLRHVIQPGTGVSGEIALTQTRLDQLDLALDKVVADTTYAADPNGASFEELLKTELARRATELALADEATVNAKAAEVIAVLDGTSAEPPTNQKQLLEDIFGPLMEDIETFKDLVVFEPFTDLSGSCSLWLDAEDVTTDDAKRLTAWDSKVGSLTVRPPKPTDITGCTLWLRAEAADITSTTDTLVDTWADRAGSNDATQAGADANKPRFGETSGYKGQPGVEFDGADDWLDIAGLANVGTDHTIVIVLRQRTIATTQHLLSANTQTSNELNLTAVVSDVDPSVGFDDDADTRSVAAAQAGDQILTWVFDATGGTGTMYRDGVALGSPGTYDGEAITSGTVDLGRTNDGLAGHFDGAISEVIVFNKALSAAELRYVHGLVLAHYETGARLTEDGPYDLPALQLSGDDDIVLIDDPSFSFTSQTVVAVVRQDALPSGTDAVPLLEAGSGRSFAARAFNTTERGLYDGTAWKPAGAAAAVGDQILTWVVDDDDDDLTMYRNGTASGTASTVGSGALSGQLGIGGRTLGADVATFPGAIAVLGVFNMDLSDTDLARVHHYLYQRTGDARRYEQAHKALLDTVRTYTSENTVVDTLSTALDLPTESTKSLVSQWLTSVSDPNAPLIADLLPATSTTTEETATTRFRAMVRLGKAARIVQALSLSAEDIEALQGPSRDPRWLRFDDLPVTLQSIARFDINQMTVREGRVALPSWLSISCETEDRTTQVGPSAAVSGLPANAARAMSRDGTTWGLLVEPGTTNVITSQDLSTWANETGTPTVTTAMGPDQVPGAVKLTDNSGLEIQAKSFLCGSFSGTGTVSLWIYSEEDDNVGPSRAYVTDSGAASTLSANLDSAAFSWVFASDTADFTASDLTMNVAPRAILAARLGSARFAFVQIEALSYPTSFIGGSRAADVLTADLAALEGVVEDGYFDVTLTYAPLYAHDEAASAHDLIVLSDGTNESNRVYYDAAHAEFVAVMGSVTVKTPAVTFARDQSLTIRVVHQRTGFSIAVSGATTGNGEGSDTPDPAFSLAPTKAYILGNASGAQAGSRLQVLDFGSDTTDARIRYKAFMALARAASLRDTFRASEGSVFNILAQAKTNEDLGELAGSVGAQTGWLKDDVSTLFETYGWPHVGAATSGDALNRLADANETLRRLGASAAQAVSWIDVDEPAADGIATAEAIVRVAKAKYGEERWPEVGRPLRDEVRDAQRGALVAYMLQNPPPTSNLTDADSLYEWLLVDVEMSPCALTSRIVQANSSIQLFVQRCLMNLEADVKLGPDAAREWAWMKNYRVWEANRKVFLYPENWMEPDWRDDRTPLFEKVESILRQGPLDEERTTLAYRTYVGGLVDIAKLEPAGITYQSAESSQPSRWHVLGRSPAPPYRLYHRMWVDGARWTPWTELDVEATRHTLLYSSNNRPTLVWAEIVGELLDDSPPAETIETHNYLWSFDVVSMSSTRFEFDKWQAPLVTREWPLGQVNFEFPGASSENAAVVVGEYALVPINDGGFGLGKRVDQAVEPRRELDLVATWAFDPCERTTAMTSQNPANVYLAGLNPTLMAEGWDGTGEWQLRLHWTDNSYWLVERKEEDQKINFFAETPSIAAYSPAAASPIRHFVVKDEDSGRRFFVHPAIRASASKSHDAEASTSPTSSRSFGKSDESDIVSLQTEQGATEAISAEVAGWEGSMSVNSPKYAYWGGPEALGKLRFETFYHPHACSFARLVDVEGVKALARWDVDEPPQAPSGTKNFHKVYKVNQDVVAYPYPTDDVDFSFRGAYSVYNWELFFHLPFLIATRLMEDERYEEAREWLHLIFDPTEASGSETFSDARRFWKVRPLRKLESLADLQVQTSQLDALKALFQKILYGGEDDFDIDEQLEAWRDEPFRPFVVARMRPIAFQKTTVLRYIENLIRWGDKLFRRDTLESVNEATQLYVLAKSLLGDRPIFVDNLNEVTPKTYDDLEAVGLDGFSNAFIEIESMLDGAPKICTKEVPPPMGTLYFCVPQNEKLLGLWDLVEDRLFKLRHCMNIEGVVRQLPLFEPPIDPALLVAAVAAGLDISSVLDDLAAPRPHYRYGTMYA
ncbi:MAG: hypothetical protein KC731_15825, partial [Myxococcales bacterium]|nr:hypothetical protein [Myxococcales bacterium]